MGCGVSKGCREMCISKSQEVGGGMDGRSGAGWVGLEGRPSRQKFFLKE